MNFIGIQILIVFLAYLLGSINSAIIVSRVMNLPDPRRSGSKNPGATNVLRTGNKLAAVITLFGDLLKGLIPVLVTNYYFNYGPTLASVCLAALLGHMYPIYYRFQGGKGVATLLGILLGINWLLALAWTIIWLTSAAIFSYSSLAALIATSSILIIIFFWFYESWVFGSLVIIAALVFWRHRSNVKHLIEGTEEKLNNK